MINPYPAGTFATSIEPGQPEHLCSMTRLYTVGCPTSSMYLDTPKIDNGLFKKMKDGLWISPLIKFSRLRVRINFQHHRKLLYDVNMVISKAKQHAVHIKQRTTKAVNAHTAVLTTS